MILPTSTDSIDTDYAHVYRTFQIEQARSTLSGANGDSVNAAYECCDRYAASGRTALFWENQNGESGQLTFLELQALSAKFANMLCAQGVKPGDPVAVLLPRTPELVIALLGILRAGAVYQPLFTAFGPKAIEYRLQSSGARIVVTDTANRYKLDALEATSLQVINVGTSGATTAGNATSSLDFWTRMAMHTDEFDPVPRALGDPMLLLFTSGTTGPAKGVLVPHRALLSFGAYMHYSLDLRPEDAFWNIADPGWAYGLYYAVIGPLLIGHAMMFYNGPFTAESTYRLIEKYGITNLAGAPTAFRILLAQGTEDAEKIKGLLRIASSAGEALNPEVGRWFNQHLGCPIHDHYGQTEGGMVLANHHGLKHPVRAGTAGRPLPGFRVAILDDDDNELPPDKPGELAVDRTASALFWFDGYWTNVNNPAQQKTGLPPRYHRTGDLAQIGTDGTVTFIGRADDVITSSGYRIGPFDVESTLVEHGAVAEAAVIGKADPERTEVVKAFIVLKAQYAASDDLAKEIQLFVKARLSAHAYPREIEFVPELPKTPSGKIQRFLLREREAGAGK